MFDEPGNHLVVFNNSNKFIELEAEKFNEYLKSDGLEHIKILRKQRGQDKLPSRELYQRCAKTLLKVGNEVNQLYKKKVGLTLELIALQNPYVAKNQLGFQLLFKNKPLKNALVVVWQKGIKNPKHTRFRTDSNGKVIFPINQKGRWMVSAVHMTPTENTTQADWQSYWASFTFGFE